MKVERIARINMLVKSEISLVLQTKLNNPTLNQTVINSVDITKDLSMAKVYVSTYTEKSPKTILKELNKSKGFIRNHLNSNLNLKKIPTLEFYYDDSAQSGLEIDKLIYEALYKDTK